MAAGDVMTVSIVTLVGEYIQLRRGLGYRLPSQERALRAFARYLDQKGTPRFDPLKGFSTRQTGSSSSDAGTSPTQKMM